ncbi:MAG: S1 RNA-binding domain-containing protein, partial [Chlamydiia bacterium]|nr:S1 RNA-binding domain-containing protein [Chlamydiia bacterium]
MEEILLNVESKEVRSAHLHNGLMQHLVIERKRERRLTGNIYKGKVTSTLDNIQSAFIDIAEQDNGFIHLNDIFENTKKFEEMYAMDFDWDEEETTDADQEGGNIDQYLKKDQFVIVQVLKEPLGSKGARLTSNISLAGRYLVLLPNITHKGRSEE